MKTNSVNVLKALETSMYDDSEIRLEDFRNLNTVMAKNIMRVDVIIDWNKHQPILD